MPPSERRPVGRPAAISRDDVLAAGLEIGMADLTIAAVAERLGVTRTSVHRHVGSRAELETLVGEHLVVAAPTAEDRGQPLEEYLLDFARLLVRHMLAHPGLAAYYNRGFPRTTASARVVEDFDATLVARGLTPRQAVRLAISVANLAIAAVAFHQFADGTEPAPLDPEAFPILAAMAADPADGGEWFDWALRTAVTGIASRAFDPVRQASPRLEFAPNENKWRSSVQSWVRFGIAVAAVLALAGCAGGAPEAAAPAEQAGAFPVTVTHGLGSTTIPAAPQRIVALSGEEDTLSVLGIVPVGFSEAYGTPGERSPWLADRSELDSATLLADTQSGVNIEQVAALAPDLILATNLYGLPDVYAQLSGIAPTVGPPGAEAGLATWQALSLQIGTAVGREADARVAVARTESEVRDMAGALPGLAGKTFTSSFYYEPGKFATIDSTETGAAALLAQLGMALSPRVTAEVVDRSVSLEQIGLLDADFVAIGFAGDTLRADLDASPLYATLPAVRDGRVLQASVQLAAAGNNPSILNVPWQLDQYRPVLERVAR